MYGTNTKRPAEYRNERLQVHEVWRTIQGEGPFAGETAVFIRLTGCNLACTFCDTNWNDTTDLYLTPKEILHQVQQAATEVTTLVVITGGEPLRQDIRGLVQDLIMSGFRVQIETAGTYWQDWLAWSFDSERRPDSLTLVCSPKTAHVHPKIFEHCDHWKYVIQASERSVVDGLPLGPTQAVTEDEVKSLISIEGYIPNSSFLHHKVAAKKYGSPSRYPLRPGVTVWISPCDEGDEEINRRNREAVAWAAMKFGYRITLQLHKILGMP